jgi:hypothetical protein
MRAKDWETVSVPAGQFRALRFINMINFTYSGGGRKGSQRKETVWFAPDVGRWIARESTGTYLWSDSVAEQRFAESGYRWELLAYT